MGKWQGKGRATLLLCDEHLTLLELLETSIAP